MSQYKIAFTNYNKAYFYFEQTIIKLVKIYLIIIAYIFLYIINTVYFLLNRQSITSKFAKLRESRLDKILKIAFDFHQET
ncbi:hypothetical protein B5P45_29120 [Phyllobacterium zundukense]|uniref:Uncharacterized protein n=1 Tax=Phyllobacterium zundukense TaxID=1867719 RepID=A0A2N9VPM7_9HYPH|nr:hypothetical protein BLM14_23720 [Phyllobacterium zundukense]PIO41445.1 hypothetical protein B5P45_29120 [Phyllobacterium zundukense]